MWRRDATWARLVAQRGQEVQSSTQDMTVESTAPPPSTVAPSATAPTPVAVDYTVTRNGDGYDAVAEIPAGTVSIHVRFVGRSVLVDMSLNAKVLDSESVDSTGGAAMFPNDVTGSFAYLQVAPPGNPADEMRITDQAHVYSTKFITVDPTYPVRVAMILVPPLASRTAKVTGYLYAADGTPLDTVG